MRTTVLEPVGAQITDLEANALDSDQAKQLERLLADHGVAVLRDQPLDDDEFDAFLRHFGDPVFTVGETPVDGHPDLNVISNVGLTRPPRSRFHVDTSYVRHPPAYTALRAVQVPAQGGQTLFSNQYRAYERLPDALRQHLEGRVVRHVVTGVDPGETQDREAEHPIFRPHPLTGRVALYLTLPDRCAGISGLDAAEAAELIGELYERSTQADNLYRHVWAPGDLVIWDNGCVMHRADHDGVVGDRVMHRGMAAGYATAATAPTG